MRVAVVGATGIAGQQFLAALEGHPYIQIKKLAASPRSAGKRYVDAISTEGGQVQWYVDGDIPQRLANLVVEDAAKMELDGLDLVFSAVESDAARALEERFAQTIPVVSTASAYRYENDVPILIPAVNSGHADLVKAQQKRGWKGFVVPIPNCTTTGLAIVLAPLYRQFGIEKVVMTSMQATSGAGRSPGVISLDIVDNIIPFIPKEEAKVERETQKLLGGFDGSAITPATFSISSTCTRVPVLDAHFESVNIALGAEATLDDVKSCLRTFGKDIGPDTHPSAPHEWIHVTEDPFRPQPRWDRNRENGMSTTVGRIREDRVIGENGVKLCLVSHNTKMGAALGAVLVAEDLRVRGLL